MDTKTQQALDDFKKFCELLHLSKELALAETEGRYEGHKRGEIATMRWRTLTDRNCEDYFLQTQPLASISSAILYIMLAMSSLITLISNYCKSNWGFASTGGAIAFAILGLIVLFNGTGKKIVSWSPTGLDVWAKLKPELDKTLPYIVHVNHRANTELFESESEKYFLVEKKPKLGDKATIIELSVENHQLVVNQYTELVTSIEECKSSSDVFSKLVTELIGDTVIE